jgi:aminoglycoside phosphotransferase (APT) family kinase protein
VEIDASLVRRLIAAQFPFWAHLPVRPVAPGGWDHVTFHLGDDMSVRLPRAAQYAAQVAKEHHWLPRLAPFLPLPVPVPLARGNPGEGYAWHWSVYRWLEGEVASIERIADAREFAASLAHFLTCLQRIDPSGGPAPGPHNFNRGGPLATYDAETRAAITALSGIIDAEAANAIWDAALAATWHGSPVWLHGDVAATNLLITAGRLSAVIDFGCSGVGDPACDLTIAWTLFAGASRDVFRAAMPLDGSTWARARGWALWKALITLVAPVGPYAADAPWARHVVDELLADSTDDAEPPLIA